MKEQPSPQIISAERLFGGLIITFDDGKAAVYSASLLRSNFDQAQKITERKSKRKPKKRLDGAVSQ